MINKLKQLYKFSKLNNSSEIVEQSLKFEEDNDIDIRSTPFGATPQSTYKGLGDGKAEFLSDFTQAEYETYIHEEQHGWGKFYKKMFGK